MCSLSPSLGPIRSVWTENRHDAAGLLGHMHRLVDSKSIETPALRTSTSRRAFLRASLAYSYVQSESKSGSNPFSMDRDPLLRAGRLDALSARSLQHQERNNLQKFRDQGKIVVEIMIILVHWPAQFSWTSILTVDLVQGAASSPIVLLGRRSSSEKGQKARHLISDSTFL